MKIKSILWSVAVALISLMTFTACADYQTVANDPLNTRIYTLDNGLKVYMTINKEAPRVQTYIAVRVGSKNDPAETTGLAHYFEHLMFKGTENYGTSDYAAEKVLLDQIEETFEVYRKTEGEAERQALYRKIDSLSFEASKYSIANEYDKLMSAIGAEGTNAYTANDMTVYQENIPSNQVENWAKIQADRFKCNVIRGFHTELETVYEEKNMSLTKDNRKVLENLMAGLYPHHPYGTQTTLGSQEHLKNPSITNIKNYYRTYYVPNNMAICMSGDIDPEATMEIIEKYFGDMEPNENLPEFTFEPSLPSPLLKRYGVLMPKMWLWLGVPMLRQPKTIIWCRWCRRCSTTVRQVLSIWILPNSKKLCSRTLCTTIWPIMALSVLPVCPNRDKRLMRWQSCFSLRLINSATEISPRS